MNQLQTTEKKPFAKIPQAIAAARAELGPAARPGTDFTIEPVVVPGKKARWQWLRTTTCA